MLPFALFLDDFRHAATMLSDAAITPPPLRCRFAASDADFSPPIFFIFFDCRCFAAAMLYFADYALMDIFAFRRYFMPLFAIRLIFFRHHFTFILSYEMISLLFFFSPLLPPLRAFRHDAVYFLMLPLMLMLPCQPC